MKIDVRFEGIGPAQNWFYDLARKQIPFAMSLAINRTVQRVKSAESDAMGRIFDNPTNWIRSGLWIQPSTKTSLVAGVYFKDRQAKRLLPHVVGGGRHQRASERHLQSGYPGRLFWSPGDGARLNAHGNISGGTITTILSVLKRSQDPYQNITTRSRARNKRPREYFGVWRKGDGLHPGVWERYGRGKTTVRPILIFHSKAQYRPIFPFLKIGQGIVNKHLSGEFSQALSHAMATARF